MSLSRRKECGHHKPNPKVPKSLLDQKLVNLLEKCAKDSFTDIRLGVKENREEAHGQWQAGRSVHRVPGNEFP